MALLHEALKEKAFDIRSLDKNLSRGLVKKSDLDKLLKTLSDDSANAQFVSLESVSAHDGRSPGRVPGN